jgi:aldose 1-epimerase
MKASISEVVFGQLDDGRTVKKYRLRNAKGTEAVFCNLGAAWIGFQREQDNDSLVLGCEDLESFQSQRAFLGATVGRFANRIGHGRFELDGNTLEVDVNLAPHHLHGGTDGFSGKIWDSHIELVNNQTPTLTFTYFSPAGESGFPANLETKVIITLTEDDTVSLKYLATADEATVINLTNHAYFNLDGQYTGALQHHEFKIDSDAFLEADSDALPTGKLLKVANTALDFTKFKPVFTQLQEMTDPLVKRAGGFDHCYCFDFNTGLQVVAKARSQSSRTQLECSTDLPGMQFYTGNFLGGTPNGTNQHFTTHGAFCFEPGFWPDSPNHTHFPDCRIDADKPFSAIIEYSFKQMEEE